MVDDSNHESEEELVARPPTEADLIHLCGELDRVGACFIVIGGYAMITAGYPRTTGDIDLLIETSLENEAKVFEALASLPDGCVRELSPGEVAKYAVVRVADEIVVDLMATASGISYEEAFANVVFRDMGGVQVPFASPELLWKMKTRSAREKDRGDIEFLRQWFLAKGVIPSA